MSDALELLGRRRLYSFQNRAQKESQPNIANTDTVYRGQFLGFSNSSIGGNPCALVKTATGAISRCEAIASGQITPGSTVSVCVPNGQKNGFMLGMPRGR